MSAHPYSFFLNGWNPDTDELTRRALDDVQKGSGLSPEIVERAQVKIFHGNNDALKDRLGLAHYDGQPIQRQHRLIEFPYFSEAGEILQYRYKMCPPLNAEDGQIKYMGKKDLQSLPYIPREVFQVKEKANRPVWFTEGEKKTLALVQHRKVAIGFPGVWNFRAGAKNRYDDIESKQLWALLEGFTWERRTLFLAMDMDWWFNSLVRQALFELTFTMVVRKALVRFVMWKGGKGIDDHLALQDDPDRCLQELESSALDLGAFMKPDHDEEIINALSRVEDLHGRKFHELVSLIHVATGIKEKVIRDEVIERQNKRHRRQTHQENVIDPYIITEDGGVARRTRGRDGKEVTIDVANFIARITEEQRVDDGNETMHRFVITGGNKRRTFPVITLPTSKFLSFSWPLIYWGNGACLEPSQGSQEHMRAFVQKHSEQAGMIYRTIYAYCGWSQIQGNWCYLMARGSIGDENIEVELPGGLLQQDRYCLPQETDTALELNAITACFEFFDLAPPEIIYPALAAVFLAPLCTILDPMPAFCMFFNGSGDGYKSTFAALLNSFWGKFTKERLLGFISSKKMIMRRLGILHDCMVIVDDLTPSGTAKEAAEKEAAAQEIIRVVGNRTGRGTLHSDQSEKTSMPPLGLVTITGELLPGMASTLSRLFVVDFTKGDFNDDVLTKLQLSAGIFPHAMRSYIMWVRDHMDDIKAKFNREFIELRRKASFENKSKKIPEHVAYLQFAWELFLTWAHEKGAVRADYIEAYKETSWITFLKVAARHAERVQGEAPIKRFLQIIGGLLAQGKVRVDHKTEGYQERIGGAAGEIIGYWDDSYYYLLGEPVWHTVQTWLRFQGDHFPGNKTSLYDELVKQGYVILSSQGKRITTHRVTVTELRKGEGGKTEVKSETTKSVACLRLHRKMNGEDIFLVSEGIGDGEEE